MTRQLSIAVRGVVVLIAVLCMATATATRLEGQQASDSVSQAAAPVAPTSSASTDLPGPRLRPDFQRVEPPFAGTNASRSTTAAGSHTITITTLALVLVVIIIVLLVAD